MAKKYFKNNPSATVYYEPISGLYLVNEIPAVLDYDPQRHRDIAAAIKSGRIIEVSEAEFEAITGEIVEAKPSKKAKAKEEPIVDETPAGEDEGEDDEDSDDEETQSPLEGLTKEGMMAWAEEQTFVSEADLNEAKKIKSKEKLQKYLQELLDLENN
jgi:hypothetical protein